MRGMRRGERAARGGKRRGAVDGTAVPRRGHLRRRLGVKLVLVVTALAVARLAAAGLTTGVPHGTGLPKGPAGLENEHIARKAHEKEDLRQYVDRSGRLRPDLWRKGVRRFRRLRVSTTWGQSRDTSTSCRRPRGPRSARHP